MEQKAPKNFYLSTMFWSVAMLCGLLGMLGGVIYFVVEGFGALSVLLLGLMVGGLVFHHSLSTIINGEKRWKKGIIDEIMANGTLRWAQWNYPLKQWTDFVEKDLAYRQKMPRIATGVIVGMSCMSVLIAFFASNRDYTILAKFLPVAILIGVMVWLFTQANVEQLKKAYRKQQPGEIILSPKGIVINQSYLIPLNYFGGRLCRVSIGKRYGWSIMKFMVEVKAGGSNTYHHYFVPVPDERVHELHFVKLMYVKEYHLAH